MARLATKQPKLRTRRSDGGPIFPGEEAFVAELRRQRGEEHLRRGMFLLARPSLNAGRPLLSPSGVESNRRHIGLGMSNCRSPRSQVPRSRRRDNATRRRQLGLALLGSIEARVGGPHGDHNSSYV